MGSRFKVFVVSSLLIALALITMFEPFKDPIKIPLEFTDEGKSLLEIAIQGEKLKVRFNTDSKIPLYLKPSFLNRIVKRKSGKMSWTNELGEKYSSTTYSINHVTCGKYTIRNIGACEQKEEDRFETLGRPFLEKTNVLFDAARKCMWLTNSVKKLKKIGFDVKKFNKVPFSVSNSGMIFLVKTEKGEYLFSIGTSNPYSVINSQIFDDESEKSILMESLQIGNKNYGQKRLYLVNFPDGLEQHGSIGLDFLKKHVVYIDYKNRCLYFGERETNHSSGSKRVEMGIKYARGWQPTITTTIEGKRENFYLDTGYSSEFALPSHIYNSLSEEVVRKRKFRDLLGNRYKSNIKNVDEFQIGKMKFKNVLVESVSNEFYKNARTLTTEEDPDNTGIIGCTLLEKVNMYFDFPNAKFCLTNEKKKPLSENRIPFVFDQGVILIEAKTDQGPLKLIVDTGASHTFVRPGNLEETEVFQLGKHNYGPRKLRPFNLWEGFEDIDGILGMDFLHNRKLYIDYPNRVLYISE